MQKKQKPIKSKLKLQKYQFSTGDRTCCGEKYTGKKKLCKRKGHKVYICSEWHIPYTHDGPIIFKVSTGETLECPIGEPTNREKPVKKHCKYTHKYDFHCEIHCQPPQQDPLWPQATGLAGTGETGGDGSRQKPLYQGSMGWGGKAEPQCENHNYVHCICNKYCFIHAPKRHDCTPPDTNACECHCHKEGFRQCSDCYCKGGDTSNTKEWFDQLYVLIRKNSDVSIIDMKPIEAFIAQFLEEEYLRGRKECMENVTRGAITYLQFDGKKLYTELGLDQATREAYKKGWMDSADDMLKRSRKK